MNSSALARELPLDLCPATGGGRPAAEACRHVLAARESERRHLAQEIHDEFGQILATLNLNVHDARGLAGDAAMPALLRCGELIQEAGRQMRNLAIDLRPTMLEERGLEATLRWLARRHGERTGVAVRFTGEIGPEPLPQEVTIACFRVAQEALTNILRHAGARTVWIRLTRMRRILSLIVHDDGAGFDVLSGQQRSAGPSGFGLRGMDERVRLLGGRLQIKSGPGHGTTICAFIPLRPATRRPVP